MSNLIRLSYNFKEMIFLKNDIIYKEGEIPNTIYILKKGEVHL